MRCRAFVVLAWLFVGCLVVQFFLVGLDVFEALGESELHRDFAYTYGWLAPGLVLLAGLARRRGGYSACRSPFSSCTRSRPTCRSWPNASRRSPRFTR